MKKNILNCSKFSTILLVILMTSCHHNDDDLNGGVSLYDLNKDILRVNVTGVATGLQAVFNATVTDSIDRVNLSQAFVNEVRFFDDKSGYFFIETLSGAWVIAHQRNQDWVGTSRIDAQDKNGKYTAREIISTVKHIGFGFVEYYFINPASDKAENKLSFVTGITPPGWFIGAGLYNSGLDEIFYKSNEANKLLVKEVTKTMAKGISGVYKNIYSEESDRITFSRNFIGNIRFFDDQSGYFFIIDDTGTSIAHASEQDLEGKNLWDLQDSQGNYIVRGLVETAKNNSNGGYYQYYWKNPTTGQEEEKISYVIKIPGTNYFIGSGVYQR